jgi:hypothetical protein
MSRTSTFPHYDMLSYILGVYKDLFDWHFSVQQIIHLYGRPNPKPQIAFWPHAKKLLLDLWHRHQAGNSQEYVNIKRPPLMSSTRMFPSNT